MRYAIIAQALRSRLCWQRLVVTTGPAVESDRADKEAAEKKAAEQRERSEEAAELERRAANLESPVD